MPNSQRVALCVTHAVVGVQVWNGARGECVTMPTGTYDHVMAAAAALLELVAQAIDWPRLLAEAERRHDALHDRQQAAPSSVRRSIAPRSTGVCGECLREALLAHGDTGHFQVWNEEPVVERRGKDVDWPVVFADALKHRRGEF